MKTARKGVLIELFGTSIIISCYLLFGTIENLTDNQRYEILIITLSSIIVGFGLGWVFYPKKEENVSTS